MDKQANKDEGWWAFLELCRGLKTTEQLNEFFDFFLTIEEKEDISSRVLISRELLKGEKTQRQIAKDLQVSIAKITRGSNSLKLTSDKLMKIILRDVK